MQRVVSLLLFIGIMFGLALQQPAQALASPIPPMDLAAMSKAKVSAAPDCTAAMTKDATRKPCKCGLAGCIAMMSSGISMMVADGSVPQTIVMAREQLDHATIVAVLHGRSTPPEPELPSILA